MTASLVVDASFTLRALVDNPLRASANRKLARWSQDGVSLYAPTLWYYEVVSSVSKLVHFDRLTPEEAESVMELAVRLGVARLPPEDGVFRAALRWTRRLGRAAAHDSFYLALAEQFHAELWTADGHLFRAASEPWVHLLGE